MSWARYKIVSQRLDDTLEGRWGQLFWVTLQDPYSGHTFEDDLHPWTQAMIDFENQITDWQLSGKLDYKEVCHLEDLAYSIRSHDHYLRLWKERKEK